MGRLFPVGDSTTLFELTLENGGKFLLSLPFEPPTRAEIEEWYRDWRYVGGEFVNRFKLDDDVVPILGHYGYEDYSGHSYVLFAQGGKLYETHGSHCSCYGLEGQWSPEEVTVEYLRNQLDNGNGYYFYESGAQVRAFVDAMEELDK